MEDKINISEMKRIINEITISESKKYGIKLDVNPISFADIFRPNFFIDNKYTLMKRVCDYRMYDKCSGYNGITDQRAVIYLDRIREPEMFYIKEKFKELYYDLIQRYNSITHNDSKYLRRLAERKEGYLVVDCNSYKRDLFQIITTCYHEIKHSIQASNDKYSYDRFIYDIENIYKVFTLGINYWFDYDGYYLEIDANLYGTRMGREYLKNNYPDIYEKECDKIDSEEEKYNNDYQLYNLSCTIDRVMPFLKVFKSLGYNNISPVLSIFLNNDGSFKRPSEVMANEKYQELDKRIVYAFFSSLSFMKELPNMQDLLPEEVNIVNEAIDYTSNMCSNQLNIYNNKMKQIDNSKGFIIRKKLQLIYMKMFFSKYKYLKKQLMSLNNSKEQINGRSRGYLSVYLLSLIISIGTIIFLYIKK